MIAWELSCAILIAVAIALRFLFRNKLGATARYALWAVVLLRLLLPLSIGQARVSVPAALEKVNARLEDSYLETPLRDARAFDSMDAYDAYVTAHGTLSITGQPNGALREVVISDDPAQPVRASLPVTVQWTKLIRGVWRIGAAVTALWFCYVNLNFARRLRRGRTRVASDAALPVYLAPGAETPCLFGLIRPAVYLPPEAAADETLRRYAVAHELTHYRHGDHVWAAARCLCVALHWWNPLVWAAAVCARRDAELACDEGTLARLGASERRPYGEALIRMTVPDKAYLLRAATMMSGADLKERIRMIAQNRKTVRAALAVVIVLLLAAAVGVFLGAKPDRAPTETPQTQAPSVTQPADWKKAYLDFFNDTLLAVEAEARTDRMIYGTALMDFDFDGVPELVVWDSVASAAAHCTVWRWDGAGVTQPPDWEFSTNIQSGRVSDRPAIRPAQTRGFWLAQDRDSGAYRWIVHSGNGQDDHAWGRYLLLDGSGAVLTDYDVDGSGSGEAMSTAWEAFMDRYTLLDVDYSDFTLSVYHITHIDETRFAALLDGWRPVDLESTPRYPASLEQQRLDDPGHYQEQLRRWHDEISMIGEQFVSEAGEAGEWWDVRVAFADRWCEKYLNASADNPNACTQCGIWELGTWLDCISLTGAPRRLAFSVALALAPRDAAAFKAVRVGWVQTIPDELLSAELPDCRYRIQTEAVLKSDDGVHWTLESLNSGGAGGWGYRSRDSVETQTEIAYALSGKDPYGVHLLRYLPNLHWPELSAAQFNTVSERLRAAALKTPEVDGGEHDQLYRDLYMLWGFKNADGAYAALFLDGPDSPLAVQYRADPETFLAALAEMDAQTRKTVRLALEFILNENIM